MKFMSKKDVRVFLLSIAITIVLAIILSVTGVLQKPLAVHVASVYALTHHLDQGFLRYQSVNYDPYFDSFVVEFKSQSNERVWFALSPASFPVFVEFDSFNSEQA